jgi:hypothetical protein
MGAREGCFIAVAGSFDGALVVLFATAAVGAAGCDGALSHQPTAAMRITMARKTNRLSGEILLFCIMARTRMG